MTIDRPSEEPTRLDGPTEDEIQEAMYHVQYLDPTWSERIFAAAYEREKAAREKAEADLSRLTECGLAEPPEDACEECLSKRDFWKRRAEMAGAALAKAREHLTKIDVAIYAVDAAWQMNSGDFAERLDAALDLCEEALKAEGEGE